MKEICLDTGVIGIILSSNPTNQVKKLMKDILRKQIKALTPRPVLIEAYYHICAISGKEVAKISILNFIKKYSIKIIDFDNDMTVLAGLLKCQHRSALSYIDCMAIAIALSKKIEFHTTEKRLKKIPHNVLSRLFVIKYNF